MKSNCATERKDFIANKLLDEMPEQKTERENIPKLLLLGGIGEEYFCGGHEIEIAESFVLLTVIAQWRRGRRPIVGGSGGGVNGGGFVFVGGGAKGPVPV